MRDSNLRQWCVAGTIAAAVHGIDRWSQFPQKRVLVLYGIASAAKPPPYVGPMTSVNRWTQALATLLLVSACGGTEGPTIGPPATLEVLAGGGQVIPVGSATNTAPRVRVRDAAGVLLQGIAVRFTVETGGGSVAPERVVTGADGTAETSWTVGAVPGTNTIRAQVENGTLSNSVSVTAIISAPSTVTAVSTTNFVSLAGTPLPALPVVEVRDGFGSPKSGVQVVFSVSAGGGTLTGSNVTTDAQGRAALGGWTLGLAPGENMVTARLSNGEVAIFIAQGLAAAITTLESVSPADQSGILGFQVPIIPRVRVRDQLGNAVPNVPVTFAVVGFGDARLSGTVGISNGEGIASPQDWVLGRVNASSTLAATVALFPGPRAEFRATGTSRPFVIDLRLLSAMKASQRDAFVTSATRWMDIITDDVTDISISRPAGDCGNGSPALTELVDDVIIFASVVNIDGPGGILGSAGPCTIRSVTALPVVGRMRFDDADLGSRESSGQLIPLILHEMGHVLGFGTVWEDRSLVVDRTTPDPIFIGTQALALWPTLTLGHVGRAVPVENTGGPGTADAHWRESVFQAELMTGYIESAGVPMPLSRMTIASMRDLGYVVNSAAGDTYAGSLMAALRQLNSVPTPINEVLVYPTTAVSPDGTTQPLRRARPRP